MKIEELDLGKAKSIIIKWAQTKPFITKVYLFGSRITGNSKKTGMLVRPDSDLDVALEFTRISQEENLLTTWTCEAKNWRKELLDLLGFTNEKDLHLEWLHETEAPHVARYTEEGSELIYTSMEKWFEELNKEAFLIFHHLNLFKQLFEILDKNKSLENMDQTIFQWMRTAFTADLVIAIGRLLDDKKSSRSFIRFLHELKDRDDYLSREKYVEKYNNFPGVSSVRKYMLELANKHFDSLAGENTKIYPADNVNEDISILTQRTPCGDIIGFRNQYLAHLSKIKYSSPPTYGELFKTFEIIETVMKKYNLIMNAAHVDSFTPIPQGYWQQPLTIPWIGEEK
ncbi:MAG: hypothetical protein AABZ65_00990 [Candidatus Omnitrophota bacterium]